MITFTREGKLTQGHSMQIGCFYSLIGSFPCQMDIEKDGYALL